MNKNLTNNTLARESYADERQELIANLKAGKYTVVVDLRNGTIRLLKSFTAKYYKEIGKIVIPKIDPNGKKTENKKTITSKATELHNIIKSYNSKCSITKGRVTERYGKKGLIDEAFIVELANPYYRTSGGMKLYDENVIQYHLNTNNEEVEKRLAEKQAKYVYKPRKPKETIEEIKETIEYILSQYSYRLYWEVGKHSYKRMVLDIVDANDEYRTIVDLYDDLIGKGTYRLSEIENDWFVQTFKQICVDPIYKTAEAA